MEVTKLVLTGRQKAKLSGNWLTYRKQLSKRICNLRRKLKVATKHGTKCVGRAVVTADDIAQSYEFGHLLLLTSERAWANAMHVREVHSSEKRDITNSTRSYIISKLQKSTLYARNLLDVLQDNIIPNVNTNDILEARAYAVSLSGALEFEKKNWEICIKHFSEARFIYSTLSVVTKNEVFKDILADPVDLSIRYCAYQMRLSRSLAINDIVRDHFTSSDAKLHSMIGEIRDGASIHKLTESGTEADNTPKTITWRSRIIDLEDSEIMVALAHIKIAEKKLSENLNAISSTRIRERASAYDDILTVSQDAVDATKHVIHELSSEGISQNDQRMQNLLITRTAISYDMISWRIDRNRVLLEERDGIYVENIRSSPAKNTSQKHAKVRGIGRRLDRLREKVALYDAILQSLTSIKNLAGVTADSELLEVLDAKYDYFSSLRCLIIARAHALLLKNLNALALLYCASTRCNAALLKLSSVRNTEDLFKKISVTTSDVQYLKSLLDKEVQRYRALVEISNLTEMEQNCEDPNDTPLVEKLFDFPIKGINPANLVVYPPVLEPAPVKPLFFDAAWNYIRYPGKEILEPNEDNMQQKPSAKDLEKNNTVKKGWFGLRL